MLKKIGMRSSGNERRSVGPFILGSAIIAKWEKGGGTHSSPRVLHPQDKSVPNTNPTGSARCPSSCHPIIPHQVFLQCQNSLSHTHPVLAHLSWSPLFVFLRLSDISRGNPIESPSHPELGSVGLWRFHGNPMDSSLSSLKLLIKAR